MNEPIGSVQFACEQLRTRMDSVEIGTDVSEILEIQGDLSRRISRLGECVSLGQENESLSRITRLEESIVQGQVNTFPRECQATQS